MTEKIVTTITGKTAAAEARRIAKESNLMLEEVAKLVERLLEAIRHADFSNGVESLGIDEGQVRAREFIDECEATWKSLKEHGATGRADEAKEKLDKIVAFVDRNQWIGNDEKRIIKGIAEGGKQ